MRPYVTIHVLTGLDGRLDGFDADVGLYQEVAAGLPHPAVLTGSGTMLTAAAPLAGDLPWVCRSSLAYIERLRDDHPGLRYSSADDPGG